MLTKAIMSAVLLLGVSSYAMAQTSTTTPSTGTPSAGSSTSGQMTESQVKQKLEQEGYSDIQLQPASGGTSGSSASGSSSGSTMSSGSSAGGEQMWTGTAKKSGQTVNIEVDSSGNVTEK